MSEIGRRVIETVIRKSQESPEMVYCPPRFDRSDGSYNTDCVYVHNGQPSCILGHGLFGAGLIDEGFERSIFNTKKFRYIEHLYNSIDTAEANWLDKVQSYQDDRLSWGESVSAAGAL